LLLINHEIEELAQKKYDACQVLVCNDILILLRACKVFVIFEAEAGQRACLQKLTVGIIPAMLEHSEKITGKKGDIQSTTAKSLLMSSDDLKFKGTNVLHVSEAAEPEDVQELLLEYDETKLPFAGAMGQAARATKNASN
jgi:hypothetical protein